MRSLRKLTVATTAVLIQCVSQEPFPRSITGLPSDTVGLSQITRTRRNSKINDAETTRRNSKINDAEITRRNRAISEITRQISSISEIARRNTASNDIQITKRNDKIDDIDKFIGKFPSVLENTTSEEWNKQSHAALVDRYNFKAQLLLFNVLSDINNALIAGEPLDKFVDLFKQFKDISSICLTFIRLPKDVPVKRWSSTMIADTHLFIVKLLTDCKLLRPDAIKPIRRWYKKSKKRHRPYPLFNNDDKEGKKCPLVYRRIVENIKFKVKSRTDQDLDKAFSDYAKRNPRSEEQPLSLYHYKDWMTKRDAAAVAIRAWLCCQLDVNLRDECTEVFKLACKAFGLETQQLEDQHEPVAITSAMSPLVGQIIAQMKDDCVGLDGCPLKALRIDSFKEQSKLPGAGSAYKYARVTHQPHDVWTAGTLKKFREGFDVLTELDKREVAELKVFTEAAELKVTEKLNSSRSGSLATAPPTLSTSLSPLETTEDVEFCAVTLMLRLLARGLLAEEFTVAQRQSLYKRCWTALHKRQVASDATWRVMEVIDQWDTIADDGMAGLLAHCRSMIVTASKDSEINSDIQRIINAVRLECEFRVGFHKERIGSTKDPALRTCYNFGVSMC